MKSSSIRAELRNNAVVARREFDRAVLDRVRAYQRFEEAQHRERCAEHAWMRAEERFENHIRITR